MKIPAPSDPSLRLVNPPNGAGRGESLVAGALVSAAVRERLDPGLYRIAIGGTLFTAASAQPLEPGMILKARVERAGEAVLLRLAAPPGREAAPAGSLAAALAAAALPNDPAARAALAALLREGMAPEPRALARVRRAALREAAEGGEWTDLAAKMEAKGLPAEGAVLEGLAAASQGRSWGGGEGGREAGDQGRRDGGGDGGGDDGEPPRLEPGRELAVAASELPRVLGALLRSLATRAASPGLDSAGLELSLFNHLRGPEGSWIVVPFRFALDAVDFAGSFRIQLPYVQGGSGRFEARFSASRAALTEEWALFLDFGGGRAKALRIEGPAGRAISGGRYDELAAELAALSCPLSLGRRGERADVGLDLDA